MMHFFPNTFKDNIAQVPAVIDDKLLKPFVEVVHGFAVIAGGMAATSCRIASFNCSIVPGRRTCIALELLNYQKKQYDKKLPPFHPR